MRLPARLRVRLAPLTAALPPAYWYLWGGTLLNRLAAFVVPFLTLYLTETHGMPLSRAAFVVSLYGAGAFAANLAGGLLADRVGRRATMTGALIASSVLLAVFPFVNTHALIAGHILLLGFFAELYRPAAAAAVADLVAPAHRADYGLAIAANGTLIVLLGLPASQKLPHRAPFRVLALAGLLLGAGFGLTGLVHTLPLYALSVAIWTLGEVLYAPVTPTLFADLSPVHLRGWYQGVHGAAWGLAKLVGPALGGFIFEYAGAGALWTGCLAVGIFMAAGSLALRKPIGRRLDGIRAATLDA